MYDTYNTTSAVVSPCSHLLLHGSDGNKTFVTNNCKHPDHTIPYHATTATATTTTTTSPNIFQGSWVHPSRCGCRSFSFGVQWYLCSI